MDEAADPPMQYENRRAGLIGFGILVIILGCLQALVVPLLWVSQMMTAHLPGAEPLPMQFLLPGMTIYGGLAVAFIWLGIGSIQCRRWARALLLVISSMWLIFGSMGVIMAAVIMPQVFAAHQPGVPELSAGFRTAMVFFSLAVDSVIMVFIPALLVFFYQSGHVRDTCEALDPVKRWTDACPLPVLAISLILGVGAAYMPLIIFAYNGMAPFFGTYLSGLTGAGVLLLMAALYGFAARACYQLKMLGWWAAVIGYGLSILSTVITFATVGVLPMYEIMGYPQSQLTMLKQMDMMHGPLMWVMTLSGAVPVIGFLVFTKRYFKK